MAKKRPNIIPIIEDARHPQKYRMLVPMVDVVFADVAQPDQVWPLHSSIIETAPRLLTGTLGLSVNLALLSAPTTWTKAYIIGQRILELIQPTHRHQFLTMRCPFVGAYCWPQRTVLFEERRQLRDLHQGVVH